jgi:hypothetical protein
MEEGGTAERDDGRSGRGGRSHDVYPKDVGDGSSARAQCSYVTLLLGGEELT